MWFLFLVSANAQSSIESTEEGSPLLAECVASEDCGAYIATQLSEILVEAGFALASSPVLTSALGGRGNGLVAELHVDTLALGRGNDLSEEITLPPAMPTIAVGYHVGSYTYDDPYPQYTVGAHLLPPLSFGDSTVFVVGGTASAAWPIVEQLWVGAEATYSYGRVRAPLVGPPDELKDIEELRPYVRGLDLDCDPCMDVTQQHSATGRVGLSVEPVPAWFLYARGGIWGMAQRLSLDVDGSEWTLGGVLPTAGFGTGVRLADRMQLAAGAEHARKSAAVTTERRGMWKALFTMGFRFGDARYREGD